MISSANHLPSSFPHIFSFYLLVPFPIYVLAESLPYSSSTFPPQASGRSPSASSFPSRPDDPSEILVLMVACASCCGRVIFRSLGSLSEVVPIFFLSKYCEKCRSVLSLQLLVLCDDAHHVTRLKGRCIRWPGQSQERCEHQIVVFGCRTSVIRGAKHDKQTPTAKKIQLTETVVSIKEWVSVNNLVPTRQPKVSAMVVSVLGYAWTALCR